MGDRVYPYLVEGAAHHPAEASLASTNHAGDSVGIEIPEKVIRKEENQSLITNPNLNQPEDYVHQQAPTDHASYRNRDGRRRRRCRRCCCCVAAALTAVVVLLGIAVLVLYLVLEPKVPKFSITKARISTFKITNTTSNAALFNLSAEVVFTVRTENPNKKIGIYYDQVDVALIYTDVQIGTGSIPAFYQGHRNTTLLTLQLKGSDVALTPALGASLTASLASDNSIWVYAKAIAHIRIKIGSWKSRDSKVQVKCHVQISNPLNANVHLLSDSCKFKLKSLKL